MDFAGAATSGVEAIGIGAVVVVVVGCLVATDGVCSMVLMSDGTAELPALGGSLAESFEGSEYAVQTFDAGTTFYRAESTEQGVGSFFGFEKPMSSADAEDLFNLAKWGNDADVVSTYTLTADTPMYVGKVAGGAGHQALLPRGLDPLTAFKLATKETLP
ncbi:hypothetical protein [Rathayibacter soli]|uniref:hypothetical protein n=1 Tax=Rathayibacter soli TaxID=3144168 RepID=UPI0027E3F3C3|nr:hypothetical protein [Glaciibacter superstes]